MIKIIAAFHFLVILVNLLAAFYLLADLISFSQNVPWYVSLPIITLILSLIYNRNAVCLLTHIENKLRKKQGLPEIKGFVRHYIINPFKNKNKA